MTANDGSGQGSATDSAPAQVVGELGAGPVQPGLDRPDRSSHRLADLLVGEVLLVEEGEHQPIIGPKPAERPLQLARQVVGVGGSRAMVGPILGRRDGGRAAGALREGRAATVCGDPQQPGAERPLALETREPAEGADKRLLHHVLGIVPVTEHPETKAEDETLIPLDQPARSIGITAADRLDQRAVVHQSCAFARGRSGCFGHRQREIPRPGVARFIELPRFFASFPCDYNPWVRR